MQRLFLFIALLAAIAPSLQATTLTLLPNSLPSNSETQITHVITGLAPGETVFVERIMDLNNNGAIDPGETSIRSFSVTDGVQTIIGGVRNMNVPADEDGAANGSIDLRLDFGGVSPILNRQPGKYIIRVSGPSGVASALFEITTLNFPQRVTGVIQNASNSAPIPYAFVVVLVGEGMAIGSVRADAGGNYSFIGEPGNYALIPFSDGFVGNFNSVSLAAGETLTQNLQLTSGPIRVSGKVTDSIGAAGLPGIFTLAQNESDGIFSGGITDASGNYTFAIVPGEFEIRPLDDFVSQLGYLTPRNGNFINPPSGSGPITLNFALPKATALIYGTVKNGANNTPIPGLRLNSDDNVLISFEGDGRTASTGDYFIGVRPGDWQVRVEDAETLGFGRSENQVTLTEGQAIRSDFNLIQSSAHVRGKVVDAQGYGMPNVRVEASLGNTFNAAASTTDQQGNFDLGLWAGAWTIHLGDLADSGRIEHFVNLTVVDGVDQNLDYAIPDATGQISGSVKDPGGFGLGNVEISTESTINGVVYRSSATTSFDGDYTLPAVNGTWSIYFNCDQIQALDFQCPGGIQTQINNNNATVNFTLQPRIVTQPTIESPILDRSGPTPTLRFTLRGHPGSYQIEGTPAIPGDWNFVTGVTISNDVNTASVVIVPTNNRFFQARVQQ